MTNWSIVVVIGMGTYLTRLSFVALFGRFGVPTWAESPLRYVGPAVLAALVAPAVLAPDDAIDLTTANPRFYAALMAVAVAVRTKSVAWTIVSGMAALWVLQAIL